MISGPNQIRNWLFRHSNFIRLVCLVVGVLCNLLLCILYYRLNFSTPLLIGFCGTIILVGLYFPAAQKINKYWRGIWTDITISFALTLAFTPFYLFLSSEFPYQIGTDELVTIHECKGLVKRGNPDLFGLSETFFRLPIAGFWINGFIANILGRVNLENLRHVNGFFGLCIVFSGYFFFRLFYVRHSAALATILLGGSHTLFALSRFAMRENHCLLIELIALTVLVPGLRQVSSKKLYAGGVIMALSLYTYYAGRILPLMWFVFLAVYCFKKYGGRRFLSQYFRLMAPTLTGLILIATPILISTSKAPKDAFDYAKNQLLIYPQGRDFIREWEQTSDLSTALLRNTVKGLTAFNNNLPDGGAVYWNYGHGLVDPLTGIFLWLGVFAVFKRRKKADLHVLALSGFFFIWLFLSFLTTKNPQYTRMLVVFPFVIILSYEGMKALATFLTRFFVRGRRIIFYQYKIVTAMILVIVLCNINIYGDYCVQGLKNQDVAAVTMRYVNSRQQIANSHYYLVYDQQHPYYWFGGDAWLAWIRLFISPDQTVELLLPESLLAESKPLLLRGPAVLLSSNELWELSKQKVMQQYPNAKVLYMSGDRKQVAIEITELP